MREFTARHMHNATTALTFELANRVMGWYGFTEAYHYELLPMAVTVACQLVKDGVNGDTLTRENLERADAATGGKMCAMWEAINRVPMLPAHIYTDATP